MLVGGELHTTERWALEFFHSVTAARRAYKPDWNPKFGQQVYDADALNTVVQATGRAVRTPTDQGVTYVLDGNFWSLYARAYSPQSFKETVRWLKAK